MMSTYGADYIQWKRWEDTSFARLERHMAAYYACEISRTRLHTIRDVLEIGFGNGAFLAYAKTRGWNVSGTETNAALVDRARSCGFDASESTDAMADKSFDLVVAFDVLEHIEQPDIAAFLATIKRLLRPGGVFLARFPNADSPFGLSHQNGDVTHVTALGCQKVEYFASRSGFDIVFMGGVAEPILCGSAIHFLHRLCVTPLKAVLNAVTRIIFFPRERVTFFASDTVIALRRP